MAGLLDQDEDERAKRAEDLRAYLNDLIYGTRSGATNAFNYASPGGDTSVSGAMSQQKPGYTAPWEPPPPPSTDVHAQLQHQLGPLALRLLLQGQHQPDSPLQAGQTTFSPGVGLGLGPFSLSANADINRQDGQTAVSPRFSAGVGGQLFGGDASLSASLTPGQRLTLQAQYLKQLQDQAELALLLSHIRPVEGSPETRFGVAYRRRF